MLIWLCLVSCYIIEEGCKENWRGRTFSLERSDYAAFEPGLTSNRRGSSLRGRRSKGKGKGIRARDHALSPSRALGRPKFPLPLPFLTPATQAAGVCRNAEMNLANPKALLKPRLVWSVCRSLGKTVHTFAKFLATPLIWYVNFGSSYHVIRHRSNKMIVPLYTV